MPPEAAHLPTTMRPDSMAGTQTVRTPWQSPPIGRPASPTGLLPSCAPTQIWFGQGDFATVAHRPIDPARSGLCRGRARWTTNSTTYSVVMRVGNAHDDEG